MTPEMAEIFKWLLTTALTVVSVYIAVASFNRNRTETDKSELEERVKREARMDAKLDESIQLGRETKESISELRREIGSHGSRILLAEEALKSLQKRMETVEKRLNALKEGD